MYWKVAKDHKITRFQKNSMNAYFTHQIQQER